MLPSDPEKTSRRDFLRGTGLLLGGAFLAPAALAAEPAAQPPKVPAAEGEKELAISPAEDLMREHAVLSRLLLIYDEVGKRLTANQDFPPAVLTSAADLIKRFVEDYHEKLEENHLFPRFMQAGRMVDLVGVLLAQHVLGRKLTEAIRSQAAPARLKEARTTLAGYLSQFSRMYRPHAARESTVLFPAFAALIPAKEYRDLGEKFEDQERSLFGANGFSRIVAEVAGLEKELGINDLSRFNPQI